MFLIFKEFILIGIALITAFLGLFGFAPERAVAPDLPPPQKIVLETPIIQEEPEGGTATTNEEENQDLETTPPQPQTTPPSPPQEPIQPAEDPFKGLADAFQRLAQDSANPPNAPQTQNINILTRAALVNILCATETAGPFNSISASGVVIDPRGVILTNAHVAQYLLLRNYPRPNFVSCIIRTGSPAQPAYTAELLFLPPSWIAKNAQKIDDANPTGNGQHDYALIYAGGVIAGSTPTTPLPHLPLAVESPETGENVLVAGYPAGFLGGITVQKELYAASANARVGELYTYSGQTVDLFSIGGSVVAQQGSSGGAVVREDGALTGVIVTSSEAPETARRDLRALTIEYILRDFIQESGVSLPTYLAQNLPQQVLIFNTVVAPTLSRTLIEVLE